MAQERGRPLPKFGEWDVNNPATAEGFTVIFNKARHEKKTRGSAGTIMSPTTDKIENVTSPSPRKTKWFCCVRV
ncbi:RPM1-interacting protein 4 family protein, putative [Theobroma cacao]|uniref:RPM1-interacting protein 4 family protein, putative n=1 Tax=Theobroma cacao TaxID=3641 RepID=A0A061FYM4_THECC|nr:RPM1-interacting protein 4 family protein, putative [Theobroma cacao]